jgi:hypothetical protein
VVACQPEGDRGVRCQQFRQAKAEMAWPVHSAGLGLPSAASGPPQNSTARLPTPATARPGTCSFVRCAHRTPRRDARIARKAEASGTLSERTCFVAETECSSLARSTPADACYPRDDSYQRRPITRRRLTPTPAFRVGSERRFQRRARPRRRPRRAIASRVDPGPPCQRDPLLRPADLTTSHSKPARQIQTKSRGAAAQARRTKGPRDGADGSIVSRNRVTNSAILW